MDMVAIVVSVVALLVGVITYARPRQGRRPVWLVTGNRVVDATQSPKLQLFYEGRQVDRVSRSLLFFLNRGFETISGDDVVPTDPIQVAVEGEILDVSILRLTRPATNFEATKASDDGIHLAFDHLDRNDGAAIEILHTGPSPLGIRVEGSIRGTKGIMKQINSPLWDDPVGFKFPIWILVANVLLVTLGIIIGWWDWTAPAVWYALGLTPVWLILSFNAWRRDRRWLPSSLWEGVGIPARLGR